MAKIIIDLNEHTINCAKCGQGIGWMSNTQLEEAIKNGVVIPDNATNGDVIEIMFPNECQILKDMFDFFNHVWCNTPYKWCKTSHKAGDTNEN